jgi:hypothetical protein
MARHHMTANGPVPFTPEEEAEWDAREAAAPAPIVPQSVTRRKALQQLLIEGYTEADIEALILQLPVSDLQKNLALIEFRESLEFERNRPLTLQMAVLMGKDEAWLDRVFIDGDKLP